LATEPLMRRAAERAARRDLDVGPALAVEPLFPWPEVLLPDARFASVCAHPARRDL